MVRLHAGVLGMSDRKSLKVKQETFDRLRDAKGQYETWDGFFHRVLNDEH